MEWVKAFHIIFMVTWFAGLFYLPRLFVYHAEATDEVSIERFRVMERRLFMIMTIGALGTIIFGLAHTAAYASLYAAQGWFHAKMALVAGLIAYHLYLLRIVRQLRVGSARHSARFYRWINELPAFFLITIVILVVVRPF